MTSRQTSVVVIAVLVAVTWRLARSPSSASSSHRQAREQKLAAIHAAGERHRIAGDVPKLEPAVQHRYDTGARSLINKTLQKCLEAGVERDSKLAGTLAFTYSIEGDPDVGGLITAVQFRDETTVKDPLLLDCVTNAVYQLEVDSPPDGLPRLATLAVAFR